MTRTPLYPKSPETPLAYSVKSTAHLLDMSERSVRRLIAAGRLPVSRTGRITRIARRDIQKFLLDHRQN